jgi:hypothetical protein
MTWGGFDVLTLHTMPTVHTGLGRLCYGAHRTIAQVAVAPSPRPYQRSAGKTRFFNLGEPVAGEMLGQTLVELQLHNIIIMLCIQLLYMDCALYCASTNVH